MTGSIFAAVLAVLSVLSLLGVLQAGEQLSLWASGTAFAITVAISVYLAGRKEHQERLKLAERLRPKLEIIGTAQHPPKDDHRRIMVHNKTSKEIEFRAKLVETKPHLGLVFPLDLQPTHNQETDPVGKIGPNGSKTVDVLVDWGIQNNIGIKTMGNPPDVRCYPRDSRLELLIEVYPTSEAGESHKRWFYAVPQQDGSVIFTANGSEKGFTKTEPSAG
jgi:hypothetical protein